MFKMKRQWKKNHIHNHGCTYGSDSHSKQLWFIIGC